MVSVEPLTATLPVAPGNVHSGVPPACGKAIGQGLRGTVVSVTDDDTWETVLDAEVSVLEAHPESATTSGTEAARAMAQIRE